MLSTLYGLRICFVTPSPQEGCDLSWDREIVEVVAGSGESSHSLVEQDGLMWACHVYGIQGEVACEFRISPDGRSVFSRSRRSVPQEDLLTLFAEPVMRSIFRARGLTSFHGAALERNGRAILLVGEKGAGKSTAAAMLICSGWSLLSDDLVRLQHDGDRWMVPTGFRHLKISLPTAQALGFPGNKLHRRWTMSGAPEDPRINKFVLECDSPVPAATPLEGIYVVGERGARDAAVRIDAMSAFDRLRALLSNLTKDPCVDVPPSSAQLREVNAVLRDIAVKAISFPDRIVNDGSIFIQGGNPARAPAER